MAYRVSKGEPKQITTVIPSTPDAGMTVDVIDEDGNTVDTGAAVDLGSGIWGFDFTVVGEVEDFTAFWSWTVDTVPYSRRELVQVAGAFYFQVPEARTVGTALGGTMIDSSYTDAEIEEARRVVEDQIEANLDTSLVARYKSERLNGTTGHHLKLSAPYVLAIKEVLLDGVDITADVELDGRYAFYSSRWPYGHNNVTVRYEAGAEQAPTGDLKGAAILATRTVLLRSRRTGMPPQATSLTTEVGTLNLAVANVRHPFGVPEVDAVISEAGFRYGVVL